MTEYRLSRFACLRRHGDSLALESGLSRARIVLSGPEDAAVVGALAEPGSPAEIADRAGALPAADVDALLRRLLDGGMLDRRSDGEEGWFEDGAASLRTWSFHDLFFRTHAPGASRRRSGAEARSAAPTSAGFDDAPFASVQASRRSVREYAAHAISLPQLRDFLHQASGGQELLPGIANPLEVYVVVESCDGLEQGLYRYEAPPQRLSRLCGRTPEVEQMLVDAARSAGLVDRPLQVLLVLAQRHRHDVPYALVLNQVGAVFQRMYLMATAMGLAPCALGSGDSDAFARAAGTDPYVEPAVGEFLLGAMR
jgi:SagB-type dehydrogenase family enzyme